MSPRRSRHTPAGADVGNGMGADLELIYVGDPMCSWCWGFAPVLEALDRRFAMPIRVVTGGLRPGPAAAELDDTLRATLRHHWEAVAAATGQPFDHKGLDREGWRYDTMVPDTAVVTMRHFAEDETLQFFTRLQRAFYAEALDITDTRVVGSLLEGGSVDPTAFLELLTSEEMHQATLVDFAVAQKLGVTGFPTLLLRDGDATYLVTRGYAPLEPIDEGLSEFVREQHPAEADSLLL